jgi:polyphosphate kinase 2 (PPK2 family)
MKTEQFLVKEGSKLDLEKHPTDFTGDYTHKKHAVVDLESNVQRLRVSCRKFCTHMTSTTLLIIFQAMDAAGKDGAIAHVMSGVNPQGCHVVSFKQPSAEERDHDFLWRCQKRFLNAVRSAFSTVRITKEVLVVRVHSEILQSQQLPLSVKNDKGIWKSRFKQIREWEDHLVANGTEILKFFLHVSKEEQKARFLSRIDEKEKNWKFSMGDVKERALWDDYMAGVYRRLSRLPQQRMRLGT